MQINIRKVDASLREGDVFIIHFKRKPSHVEQTGSEMCMVDSVQEEMAQPHPRDAKEML